MYQDLTVFRMAHAMARHAGMRQAVVSENMANADTPNYLTRDVTPFADTLRAESAGFARLTATRSGHFSDSGGGPVNWTVQTQPGEVAPNGNSVSIEQEMLKAVAVQRQHDKALAIYKSNLAQLRASIGRF